MKRACFDVFMFGFLLLVSPANASIDTGNSLLNDRTSQNPFDNGYCYGVISGYFASMRLTYTCSKFSTKITRGQVKDVVVKSLQDNPGDRHLPATALAYRAFYLAFDCKPLS
jgi:Rap1a immunity proteins